MYDSPAVSHRSQGATFLFSYFLGIFGADRFYLGQTGLGIAKLLTCGGCGIWAIVDCFLIGCGMMKDVDGLPLSREVSGTPTRSQAVTYLLAAFLGMFGADRFYLGQTGLGIAKLLTCGGCGIWSLVDVILAGMAQQKDVDGNSLQFS
jgi:TM2 domain-containing membrane protein YozV